MSININGANTTNNIYWEKISNDNSLKDVLDKFRDCSIEDLEAMGYKRMTPISKEEEEALKAEGRIRDAQPVFVDIDSSRFMEFVNRKNISWLKDNMIVYLDREIFTSQELQECYEVLQKASSFVSKGSLDYRDYAAMGIAANVAKNYAYESLSQRQAKVIEQTMNTYLDSIVQAEQKMYDDDRFFKDDHPYYNVNLKPDLDGTIAGILIDHPVRGTSASNEGLINVVYSLFAQVDLKNTDAVNNAFNTYRQLVAPAYASRGVSNTKNDENSLKIKLSNAKAILINAEKKVDCSV